MKESSEPELRRRALLVLGMHRSGTSALTRILSFLGARLPGTLLPPNEFNEAGYWESNTITGLHDRLLASGGTSWLDPAPFPESWYGSQADLEFRRETLEAIDSEFGDADLFVIKDPRISRIVPFWLSMLESAGIEPYFIIAHRHPLEVAASLERRDGLLTSHALTLWLRHLLEAEKHTRGLRRSMVSFEGLMADWRGTVEKIAGDLGLQWPKTVDGIAPRVDEFLLPKLRHHTAAPGDLADGRPGELMDHVRRVFHALAGDEESLRQELDRVRGDVERVDASGNAVQVLDVELLLSLTQEIGGLRQKVRDAESARGTDLSGLQDELRIEHDVLLARHRAELETETREEIARLKRSAEERESELAELRLEHARLVAALDTERRAQAERSRELREARRDFGELSALLERTREELVELSQRAVDDENALHAVLQSKSWALTRPLRAMAVSLRGGRPGVSGLLSGLFATLRPRLRGLPEGVKRPLRAVSNKVQGRAMPAGGAGRAGQPAVMSLGSEVAAAFPWIAEELGPGPHFEEEELVEVPASDIRLIAFYLPQYHPFPENDEFWGKGFTEWTNTSKALPQFEGHFQPRRPGELGYYDLRIKEVQRRQIELARQHGIHGFCYHHYWFSGRPVMRRPFNQFLEDPSLDFPFCLHWANEPWTSSWDGLSGSRVLLSQEHSANDDLAFIRDITPALRDSRYIRINGKPLLLLYRPGLFPDIRATVDRWQQYSREEGIGELYLAVMQQGFDGETNPADYGFDAAVEFPPHNAKIVDARSAVELHDAAYPGHIFSYPHMVEGSLKSSKPDYKLFRGLVPAWDCTARRREATLFVGSTPDLYQKWLEGLCRSTRRRLPAGERLVFINAWNEWAEGAYLEPDEKYGYAFLNRTGAALRDAGSSLYEPVRKVVIFGHDAARAGAQILLVQLLRWLVERTATEVRIVLIEGGDLLDQFEDFGDVLLLRNLFDEGLSAGEVERRIAEFAGEGVDLVYGNTAVTGRYLAMFEGLGAPIITHVHELEESLQKFCGQEAVDEMIRLSERLITASPAVAENLVENHGVPTSTIEPIYAFIDASGNGPTPEAREQVRRELGLTPKSVAVFGCGTRDWRKAPDIFVEVADRLTRQGVTDIRFFWIGAQVPGEYEDLERGLAGRGLGDVVSFLGVAENPRRFFAGGDIFLLSSREDPFPLVCLEAADCFMPTVCFGESGGMPDFVEDDAGVVVPYDDIEAMSAAVGSLVEDGDLRRALGNRARQKLLERHTVDIAMPEILHVIREVSKTPPAVSVILPNYNYAHYLERRVESILRQTFQDIELLIEDDCSTDGSLDVLARYADRRSVEIVEHSENRGAFAMWLEGLRAASADLVWIAEADDLCEPRLLERLLPFFDDRQVGLAYAQSHVIDEHGTVQGDYSRCFPDLSETKWLRNYVNDGRSELAQGLAIKNTILNASAVVFRKPPLELMEKVLRDFVLSGDWYLYLNILEDSKVAYCAEKLNYHRRHSGSIIGQHGDRELALVELATIHNFVLARNDFDRAVVEKMVAYAYEMWRGEKPEADLADFWATYQLDLAESERDTMIESVGALGR